MRKLVLVAAWSLVVLLCACGHTHVYTEQIVAPTCTENGYTEFTCECGEHYRGATTEAGHNVEVLAAKEATCSEAGLTEGSRCTVCGETLTGQKTVAAKGHSYGDWVVTKESTTTEVGQKQKECAACGDKQTAEIPVKDDPQAAAYTVTYDLNGGGFFGGYASTAELGAAFLTDFNRYGDGSVVTKENFQSESHPCVKTSLSDPEMLAKWNWLWVYMLEHLQEINAGKNSEYITDTYPILERMIQGDTTAILENANARTSIRSYIHGLLNAMKGCGDINLSFSVFSPDFSSREVQEEFLKHQYNLTVTISNGEALAKAVREGYEFLGWENKYGDIIDKATCHGTLVAVWKELSPVEKIEITNKVTEISLHETYQLTWAIIPGNAGNQTVRFETDNKEIASVDDNGLITALGAGEVTITIVSLSQHGHTDTMTVAVVAPEYFDIRYETESYVEIGNEIKLSAVYIDRENKKHGVTWRSLDETLATVDENGFVTGKAAGVVTIRATVKDNESKHQDFIVTVLTEEMSEALRLVLDAHESNVFVRYDLAVGAGTPSYYSDIFGSVSRLLYNQELEIDYTYNQKTNDKYGNDLASRVMASIEFITVHYTGNYSAGADGAAHGDWFAAPKSENNTSIHYSTGNDGVYKGLDEQYRAAHAGDDGSRNTVSEFSWIDTPVEVLDTDPEFRS